MAGVTISNINWYVEVKSIQEAAAKGSKMARKESCQSASSAVHAVRVIINLWQASVQATHLAAEEGREDG